jgi:archaellum biogenesis ATPase FlaH
MARTRHIKQPRSTFIVLTLRPPVLMLSKLQRLHFFSTPMLEMNLAALGNQIEQRLTIARAQLFEFHRNVANVIRNFENRNPKVSLS